MPKNPARTFALVNLAIFAMAVVAFLWLRDQGMLTGSNDHAVRTLFEDSTRVAADTLSARDVQPASAAQVRFLRELLADTSHVVRRAVAVRAPRRDEAYYLGAEVGRADTSRTPMALWLVVGPQDQPRSVQSLNDAAEQYSVAHRTPPTEASERAARAAAEVLTQRLDAASTGAY